MGLRLRPEGRGVGRECDGYRQRYEGTLGQENPGADRDLSTGLGRQGEATYGGRQVRLTQGTILGHHRGGKIRRSVAADGQGLHPCGRLLHNWAREGGGKTVK